MPAILSRLFILLITIYHVTLIIKNTFVEAFFRYQLRVLTRYQLHQKPINKKWNKAQEIII